MHLTHLAWLIAVLVILAAFITVALAVFLPTRVPIHRRWPSEAVERRLREITAQIDAGGGDGLPAKELDRERHALVNELKRRGLGR